ncbi:MAG: AI-2E family transporter [Geobacteraceae bacterium]|nr:AI-2E family transporter [Geobacteraceae bacterium]
MKNKDSYLLVVAGLAAVCAVLSLYYLGSVLLPLFIAFILAFLCDPLVAPLKRRGVSRPLAIAVVFLLIFILVGGAAALFVSSITEEFRSVRINLPAYAGRLYEIIPLRLKEYLDIETPDKVYRHIDQGLAQMRGASLEIARESFAFVKKAFASTLAFVLTVLGYFIIPIYLYYFLKDLPKLRGSVLDLVPARYRERVTVAAGEIHEVLSAFVRGQLAVCAILAVLYSAGLYLIGIDLAVVIGTLAGIAFIIPYLGTVLGIVLSMIMAALKFQDLLHPLLCLGWFAIVQGVEGAVITPRIVGEKVGLHPLVVIVALLIGGQLFGIFGMLLAVPVTAVLNVFSRYLLDAYRNSAYFKGV